MFFLIQKIVNQGINAEDDFHEKRKIQMSNFLLVFLFALNIPFLFIFTWIIERPVLFWDAFFTIIFVGFGYYLNVRGYRVFLRNLIILGLIFAANNLSFRFGETSGYQYYFLCLLSVPFFLFENKVVIFSYFGLIFLSYLTFDFWFAKTPLTPDPELSSLYYFNGIVSVFIFIFIIYNFKYESFKYQQIIDEQVKGLSELSFKLMAQKDEILLNSNKIKEKSQVFENQNKLIFDALRLASMVQREALPSFETIFFGVKSGFLLYKPKDIVSGDFYWSKPTPHGNIIVVADCIGHGVPGAMMAVLAANLISQIVEDQGKTFPSDILEELDKRLRRRIKQDPSSELADGMDISVVLVAADKVYFAAASRPIVKIDTTGKVQIVKGTRVQLATWKVDAADFETIEIDANPGDRFYLFTDGATDQLSMETGKRLGSKSLIKEITQMQHFSLSKQKDELESFFTSWQGSEYQTDDIIILGFEV